MVFADFLVIGKEQEATDFRLDCLCDRTKLQQHVRLIHSYIQQCIQANSFALTRLRFFTLIQETFRIFPQEDEMGAIKATQE